MSFSREMKASGRQEFVIQTSLKLDEASDFVLDVQLCRANMSRTPVIPHIWRRTAMCQANRSLKIPRLHFPCPSLWLLNKVRIKEQQVKKLVAYQAVHFGVGNIVGLLGSYLKWTNKMSALFSHVLIWGFRLYHYELTLCQRQDNHSDFCSNNRRHDMS